MIDRVGRRAASSIDCFLAAEAWREAAKDVLSLPERERRLTLAASIEGRAWGHLVRALELAQSPPDRR